MEKTLPGHARRRLLHRSLFLGLFSITPAAWAAGIEAGLDGQDMPYAAFERLPHETIAVGEASIRVAFGPGEFRLSRARIMAYIEQSAHTVALYFGSFPARAARLLVLNTALPGRPIRSGTAFGYKGAAIKLTMAAAANEADLDDDWILVHEMCHLALPSLPRRHRWFEEGMASYVEPLARAQAGLLNVERVWADMIKGMPQGLPGSGDRGLDFTPTWGRTYWGGALFCLLADIEIREATAGRRSLQHALRRILEHGNIEQESALEPLLRFGDEASGVAVLASLYARMKDSPYPIDLDRLWSRLGITTDAREIRFDDAAPLAMIRSAMTQRL